MFGNKNSAVPYVRIGGVDRQSVLTSNANGNTPVKEIGVNANGNLIFSTDLATFKSVLDLKYSQFKSNDENQEDTWETEKSVSMKATNGTSTTQLIVSPTGAKVNDKEIATTDKLPDTSKLVTTDTRQNITGVKVYDANINLKDNIAIVGWDFYGTSNNLIKHYTKSGEVSGKIVVGSNYSPLHLLGRRTRPYYGGEDYETGKELALLSDVPSVQQSTGTSTTATMSQNAITSALSSKADISAIPTALSQLSEDTTHRVVTDTEKSTWNAKSNFDGDYNSLTNKPNIPTNADFTLAGLKEKSYNSLTDKPTIPTKTSQLTNDSNFATTSQLNDKASISSQNTFAEKQIFSKGLSVNSSGIWLANAVPIKNSDENSILQSDSGTTIVGNTSGNIQLFGAGTRPTYTPKYGNTTNIALYTDIPDVKKLGTTNWTVSQDSSGNLVFKYE